jgi:diguanylate cyclase (GGDEF)-like protein
MARAFASLKFLWDELVGTPPAMPAALRDQLSIIQFDRLRQRIPILYIVLAMISVGAGLAAQGDFPIFLKFAAPAVMLAASALRSIIWVRRRGLVVDGAMARSYLRRVNLLSIALMAVSSIWAASSFMVTDESSRALVIIFIFLAASACASSLASLPSAAILCLIVGLSPTAFVMFASGNLQLIALAANVVAVSIFQSRLIVGQFGEMVRNLMLQSELEAQANTDALTGLHNRRAFARMLDDRIACCAGGEFAIAMLDLDGFKPVNDRFGHAAGDGVLVMLANRLQSTCGPDDRIARIGGDEFAIIFGDSDGGVTIEDRISAIGQKLAEPYQIDGHQVFVSASIGTARFPTAANTAAGLLDAADAALYIIKSGAAAGRDRDSQRSARPTARRAA